MTFSTFTRFCFVTALLLLAGMTGYSVAQQQAAPPSCEQQLEATQREVLRLEKQNAQATFRAASLQESMLDLQKKQAADAAKTKAAQGPASTVPTK